MKLIIIGLIIFSLLILVGCDISSSYEDCNWDCTHGYHQDELCTDDSDWWDGCTDEEKAKLDKLCYNECRGS